MTIHTASKHIYKLLIAIGLLVTLASCGGGGGASKDTSPDAFTFTAVANAAVNVEVTSTAITMTGVNQAVSISITGGTYSIGGGAFTNVAGTISKDQTVSVKVTSATTTNTPVEAVLTIGGVSANFTVTTAPDVTPDAFSFTTATGVVPKSVSTSAAITVTGIDIAVPISITGGEYSINDGAFTSAAGTVSKTQTVKVRGTAASTTNASSTVGLTVGGVSGTYAITTLADTVAPTAQILFPPPVSMTEGNTILVRGSASDDYNTVTSVKVNGVDVTPKAAGDFSTWQISVPLTATTDTNLVVATEDSKGNKSTSAAQVMIRQADHKNAFPDANIVFDGPSSMVVDKLDGRNSLLVADLYTHQIVSVDLSTGKRTSFVDDQVSFGCDALTIEPGTKRLYAINQTEPYNLVYFDLNAGAKHVVAPTNPYIPNLVDPDASIRYRNIFSLIVDNLDSAVKIVGVANTNGEIISNNISSTTLSVISNGAAGIPNSENLLTYPQTIVLDRENSRYLVTNGGQDTDFNKHAIYAIDRNTGARSVLSSNLVGTGDNFTTSLPDGINTNMLRGLALDSERHQAIVSEWLEGKFYTVDLITGNRKLFSDSMMFGSINNIKYANAIALDSTKNYLFVSDDAHDGIYAVDLVTGQRVIFSKSISVN